jgi:glycosyltransferase involved in cell wall biosynthesis
MESALREVVTELRRRDVDVSTVALSGPGDPTWPGSLTTLGLPRGAIRTARAAGRLRAVVGRDPNAAWVGVGLWAYVPLLAAAPSRTSVTAWEHSVLPWRLAHDKGVRVHSYAARPILSRARRVVAVSPSVAATMTALTRRTPVTTIPNVVDLPTPQVKPPRDDDTLQILCLGSLRRVKAFDVAVQTLPHLPDDARLRVVGEGPERPALTRLAHELEVHHRVEFAGHVDDPRDELRTADVLLHPAHCETFGYSLLEAGSAGTPVVVRDAPAMSDMVPSYAPGIRARGSTPEAFAQAVIGAVEPSAFGSTDYAQAHRRVASDFSAASVGQAWLDLLREG